MDKKRENDFTINLAKSLIELHQWSPSEILDLPGWELMHTSAILEELSEVLRKLNEIEALKQLPPVYDRLEFPKIIKEVSPKKS